MAEGGAASPGEWSPLEAVIIKGLRQLRARYLQSVRGRVNQGRPSLGTASESADPGHAPLCGLPVDMQLYILSFLSPQDLCVLGLTSRYWHLLVQDRVLWRYFLLRDLPSWPSVEWHNLPDMDVLNSCFSESQEGKPHNYMSIYLKCCPKNRKSQRPKHPIYGAVTSFLQSLVTHGEPRFAMFGPGIEQMDDSLVTRMMTSPDLVPVMCILQKQIHGIGSGVTFQLDNQHKFNILTLYSTTRAERDRARVDQNAAVNKMFVSEDSDTSRSSAPYSLIPQVKEVCRVVHGFIYVANADSDREHNRQDEVAQIQVMTDPEYGPQKRPLLVLSCVTHPRDQRIPCVYMAHELCLNRLNRPWMVQNTEVSTLNGLSDGIEWILSEVGRKM
ncbi:F-box only protein 4 [Spea bombifrons]|uniref:F-box only protein 4 n=1 Tax=Spea bombifrons TaxID=233779 RepID=UPI002349DA52|nr:F-box only protein 4 [Spea bombifrons]